MGVKLAWGGLAFLLAVPHFLPGVEIVGIIALIGGAVLIALDK